MTMKMKLALAAALALPVLSVSAQNSASPRGIYRDPSATSTQNGVAYRIMLIRSDARQEVPVNFAFRSGDRFKLQLNLKDSAYVYVLNRTFDGDPKEMSRKDLETVRDEDHAHRDRSRPTYTLLYPGPGEEAQKISGGRFHDIPGDAALRMDKTPGVEKVYVVLSDHPLEIPKMFTGGRLKGSGQEARKEDGDQSDSSDDVLDRLDKDLSDWSANSKTENPTSDSNDGSSKGIERESYTVGSRNQPVVAEINLAHYRN
jgi:hypothetical protein